MTDNIIPAFGGKPSPAEARIQPPSTFEIVLKTGKVINETGYLALGGYVAILANPNDSLNIKFATEASNVEYVSQTDEVIED